MFQTPLEWYPCFLAETKPSRLKRDAVCAVSEPRAVATGSPIICHFHLAFVIVGRVNDFLKGRGLASENGKLEMINAPVATARGSDSTLSNC